VNAIKAEEYILTVWRRGSLVSCRDLQECYCVLVCVDEHVANDGAHAQIEVRQRGWSETTRRTVRDEINRRRRLQPLNAMDVVCFLPKTIVCAAFMMQAAHVSECNYVHFCRHLSLSMSASFA